MYRDPANRRAFASVVEHFAVGEVTRETSTSLAQAGGRDGGCARDEVEDGIGIANIPLLRLSDLSSLSDPSTARSDPERVRNACRGAYFTEFSPDNKSPDFFPADVGFRVSP